MSGTSYLLDTNIILYLLAGERWLIYCFVAPYASLK